MKDHIFFVIATSVCWLSFGQGYKLEGKSLEPQISEKENQLRLIYKSNWDADVTVGKLQKRSDLLNDQKVRISKRFPNIWELLHKPMNKYKGTITSKPTETRNVCSECEEAFEEVRIGLKQDASNETLFRLLNKFCDIYNSTEDMCQKYQRVYGNTELYIFNRTRVTPAVACSYILPNHCDVQDNSQKDWFIEIPPPLKRAPLNPPRNYKGGKRVLKVLQLSDTHFDSKFKEGAWDECNAELCCRDPPPNNEAARSGKWGGWKCDIPERTLDSLLEFVANNITGIDHVIWTGDMPAHDVWDQTRKYNLEIINKTISKLKYYYPYESVVLPSIGNHETVPAYFLTYPNNRWGAGSNEWLYNVLAAQWTSPWLELSKSETIRRGGFYVTTYRPGLLMISLNSVFCYKLDWWLMIDNRDPADELSWLVKVLTEAEQAGDKVHISAHVPPGYVDCIKIWRINYYRIIERFRDTVVAQFFGHTHFDEFELIPDSSDPEKAVAVMYVGGSATTFISLNPGFRIYYIDGDYEGTTRKVLDYETWIMDLENSNRLDTPIWKKLYTAKKDFGLKSLDPDEWMKLYQRIKTNRQKSDNTECS